jgi:hypothetical protein
MYSYQRGNHKGNQKIFELNEKVNTACQNVGDAAESMLTGQLIALRFLHHKVEMSKLG